MDECILELLNTATKEPNPLNIEESSESIATSRKEREEQTPSFDLTEDECSSSSSIKILESSSTITAESSKSVSATLYQTNRMLIALVRKHPALYDAKNKHFQNSSYKEKTWSRIANQLALECSECLSAWAELRYKYQCHVHRLRKFYNQNHNNAHHRRPIMLYEQELLFLYPHVKVCPFKVRHHRDVLEPKSKRKVRIVSEAEIIDVEDDDGSGMRSFRLTKELVKLIDCVRPYPQLYNTHHPSYWNYRHRGYVWGAISNELGQKATKLMKTWLHLHTRFEWEHTHLRSSTALQSHLQFLAPHIGRTKGTVCKVSYYLRDAWHEPIEHFRGITTLLNLLKKQIDLCEIIDQYIENKQKPKRYHDLWRRIGQITSYEFQSCEVTWLTLRTFYLELAEMRRCGYQLQDKWFFETTIGDMYALMTTRSINRKSKSKDGTDTDNPQSASTPRLPLAIVYPPKPGIEIVTLPKGIKPVVSNPLANTSVLPQPMLNKTVVGKPTFSTRIIPMPSPTADSRPTISEPLITKPLQTAVSTTSVISDTIVTLAGQTVDESVIGKPAISTPNKSLSHNSTSPQTFIIPKIVSVGSLKPISNVAAPSTCHMNRPVMQLIQNPATTITVASPVLSPSSFSSGLPAENSLYKNAPMPVVIRPKTINISPTTPFNIRSERPKIIRMGLGPQQNLFKQGFARILRAPAPSNGNGNMVRMPVALRMPKLVPLSNKNEKTITTPLLNSIAPLSSAAVPPLAKGSLRMLESDLMNSKPPAPTMQSIRINSNSQSRTIKTAVPCATPSSTTQTNNVAKVLIIEPDRVEPKVEFVNSQLTGKMLHIYGASLLQQYQLTMSRLTLFIREVMAIPQLHCNDPEIVVKCNDYWYHISRKFHMPEHVCRACWNFLKRNIAMFPQISNMSTLMRPFKSKFKAWETSHKLFSKFDEIARKHQWQLHQDQLPDIIEHCSKYEHLYSDLRRDKMSNEEQPRLKTYAGKAKQQVWNIARVRFPNINASDVWQMFKFAFKSYLEDLERGIENPWPQNWWQALEKFQFLINVRYHPFEPYFYIVYNKFHEEVQRCSMYEALMKPITDKGLLAKAKGNDSVMPWETEEVKRLFSAHPFEFNLEAPKRDNVLVPPTGSAEELMEQLNQSQAPSSPILTNQADDNFDSDYTKTVPCVDAFQLTATMRRYPNTYEKCSSIEKRKAWVQTAEELNATVTDCRVALQNALFEYRTLKQVDPANRCRLNQKYYRHLDEIYKQIMPSGKLQVRTPHDINQACCDIPAEPVYPERYLPEINMHTSKPSLVIKNWTFAAGNLSVLAQEELRQKVSATFAKYATTSDTNTTEIRAVKQKLPQNNSNFQNLMNGDDSDTESATSTPPKKKLKS